MKTLGLFNNLFLRIESQYRKDFRKKIRRDNVERVYILSCIGILFLFFLLILDYLRYSSGLFQTALIYKLHFYTHLALAGLIIPIIIIFINSERIQKGEYRYSLALIYSCVIYAGMILMTMAILTIIERNAVLVYGLFVLVTNFVVIFPHIERIIFNALSLGIILTVIYLNGVLQDNSVILMYINMLECSGASFLGYALSHYLYNDEVKRFTIEKVLHEKNLIIEGEKKVSNKMAEELKKVNIQKNKLYANITHEFRTPLTVILGMNNSLKLLIERRDSKKQDEAIEMIDRNGKTLLKLINEMLDLSKLESGIIKLNLVQRDIIAFLRYVHESFQSFAVSKNIHLSFLTDLESFTMDFDAEKMQKVLSNLLSNAIKFTPEAGKISVLVKVSDENDEKLMISVKDSGIGIPADKIPFVFDRFYQVEGSENDARNQAGSGIGLALTKELIKLMGGAIEVKSEKGQGTEFIIKIPVTRNAEIAHDQEMIPIQDTLQISSNAQITPKATEEKFIPSSNLPLVLVIEDNPDIVHYLKTCLDKTYLLEIAYDGEQGIEKAIDLIPDIIISDVMMPKKDGYEVCETLKNDERTSHIPIIMLTAKATVLDKLTGLERGADAYLSKPFNREELLLRLRNLIEMRKQLQEKYSKGSSFWNNRPEASGKASPEDAFLTKVNQLVEENIGDEDFGILQLCKGMAMSRSQIHRKIKALTNLSTSIYIRTLRLYKAKELLQTTDLNISEIAYEVGFKDPNYFTHVFVEEFEITPSATRK